MGASKREFEKMNYVIFTQPLSEQEFNDRFYQPQKESIRDWTREPDDYKENFKTDTVYKQLNNEYREIKKARDNYKEIIRNK